MIFRKLIAAIFLLGFIIFSGLALASSQDNVPTHASKNPATVADEEHATPEIGIKEALHGAKTHEAEGAGHGHANLGEILPLWSCIPFACMLLSIALFPLAAPNFWHHHFGNACL